MKKSAILWALMGAGALEWLIGLYIYGHSYKLSIGFSLLSLIALAITPNKTLSEKLP